MTAREKFQIGQPVRLTAWGEATFPQRRTSTGVVVGFSRQDDLVEIRPDGGTACSRYHMEYWEVVPRPRAISMPVRRPWSPGSPINLRGRAVVFMDPAGSGRARGEIITRIRDSRWLIKDKRGQRRILDESEFTVQAATA